MIHIFNRENIFVELPFQLNSESMYPLKVGKSAFINTDTVESLTETNVNETRFVKVLICSRFFFLFSFLCASMNNSTA